MKNIKHIASVFIFLFTVTLSFSQGTPEELKGRADELFEKEQYVEATNLYSRVLAQDARDLDVNFRYGACLLYNSYKKKDALKYLKFALTDPNIDSRAYFFYGKALHLDYQFEDARKNYLKYISKRAKLDERYDADRAIQMCQNGKRLLTTFTDIIVAEKQEIDESKFFKIYSDSKTLGGQILVTADFQSKLDKKMGHVPTVHFPPNAKAIYYSSYGDDLSTGKDIFVRRRLPNNKWGEPQKLPGGVNTNEDEDFPYMHPSGNFLYFSSKGHNSMGGYDVFMSRMNHDNGSFGTPENVDFAISSPDDDLFYVVDSLFQNAYFASARQSQDGKLHVYRVKVARVPIQEVIIMGDFVSEINPELKDAKITLVKHSNGNELANIKTNPKGKYSYVFPQGGEYDYQITIGEGDEVNTFTVELPFLDEFRPLKQRILHTRNEDGDEIVQIVNMFNDKVEGADALVAQVIRKKAELNVNVDEFDLDALEAKKREEEALAELGFRGMSLPEVGTHLEEIKRDAMDNSATVARVGSNLEEEIIAKSDRIIELDKIEKELTAKARESDDPALKYRLLGEAEQKQREKMTLISQVKDLKDLKGSIDSELGGGSDSGLGKKIEEIEKKFKELVEEGDSEGALKVLTDNKDILSKAKEASPKGLLEEYVEESIKTRKKIDSERDKLEELERAETEIKENIKSLERRREGAKKRDLEEIDRDIEESKRDLEMTKNLIKSTKKNIQNLEKDLNSTEEKMASFQNAMATEEAPAIDPAKSEEADTEVSKIASETPTDFEAEIKALEEEHPELTGDVPVVTEATKIMEGYKDENDHIDSNPTLSELEKTYRKIDNNTETINDLDDRVKEIEAELEGGANPDLEKEKEEILTYKEGLEKENEELEKKAEELKATTPDVALSPEDVIKEIAPTHEGDIASIESDPTLTDKERLEEILETEKKLLGTVSTEIEEVEKKLEENPDDEEAKGRKTILETILSETEKEIAETETKIAALPSEPVATGPTKEEVIKEIAPGYEETVKSIEEDPDTTPLHKEKALVEEDKKLLEEIEGEKKGLEKKVKKDPEDEDAKERLKAIEEIERDTETRIEEREEKIKEIEEGPTTAPTTAEVKEEIIADVAPKYTSEKEDIEESDGSVFDKKVRTASVEAGLLEQLIEEKGEIEKDLEKNPEDEEAKERLKVVEQMIAEQESILEEIVAEGVESLTPGDRKRLIGKVDPSYESEIVGTSTPTKEIEREKELQEKIKEEIEDLEKKRSRKPSVSIDLTIAAYEKLLKESEERAKEAGDETPVTTPTDEDKEMFVTTVRNAYLDDTDEVTKTYTSKDELEEQDKKLEAYEKALEERIEEVKGELEEKPSDEGLEKELEWLEEEKATVTKKRRSIRMSIGELETDVIASTPSTTPDDKELKELDAKEKDIEARLTEDMTSGERKKLSKELEGVREDKEKREGEIIKEELAVTEEKGDGLIKEIDEKIDAGSPIASGVKEHYKKEDKEIDELVEEAEKAGSEAEKKYLLEEAKKKRETLNREVAEVLAEETMGEIEEDKGISLSSREDLERKKRKFTISLGEITREIAKVEEEIDEAKRREIPALEAKKESLIAEKELIEERLKEIDEKLSEEGDDLPPVVSKEARDTPITFGEERTLAGTESYEEYKALAEEALKVENEIRTLEEELEDERAAIQRMIIEGADPVEIDKKAEEIKRIESEIDRLSVDLTYKKHAAEEALPKDEDEAMKMRNMVARGIAPIKKAATVAAVIGMPATTGLAIDTASTRVNHGAREIPIGMESPSGLVYRVQVGAFSRPLPPTVFKEFNPVSGEKIEGTTITRYMAGFFNSSDDVVKARGDIRALGYSDAFVVAYCDGKRITFGEARRLEASGDCVPKGTSEIMIEVAEKTAESLGIPVSREVPEVPELTYMDAPGAADADPIENMKGLFFTVQVGVFNRPVGSEAVHDMPDIITIRLPNGQIRYSSGKFDSAEDALPRQKEARAAGVNGAFITAYYNGERISIGNARKLLRENGKSILQSEMEKEKPVEKIETPDGVVRTDSVSTDLVEMPVALEKWEHRVQIVTKKTFDEFPRDVLNRYNAEGSFYYDEKDKKVKSVIYKNADYLPRVWNFRDDIDTVYLPVGKLEDTKTEIIEVVFSDSIIPGDFMDWMLRCNYRREITKSLKGTELRIFGVQEDDLTGILDRIKLFGIEPEVILESEEELELEE